MTNIIYFSHVYEDGDESVSTQSLEISQQLNGQGSVTSSSPPLSDRSQSLCSVICDKISNWIFKRPEEGERQDASSSYPVIPVVINSWISDQSNEEEAPLLPSVEGLEISGEAFPGKGIQACGFAINGTTRCNFQWVRYLEDGSFNYIDGEKQPYYLVTADDVDTCLAIKVQALDNLNRKGELFEVFANGHSKITCDAEMEVQIHKSVHSGHASYKVFVATKYHDIWEPAILTIEREGYSIKFTGPSSTFFGEKFLHNTAVKIPDGHGTSFAVVGSTEHLLRAETSFLRDTIVLTMRLFIIKDWRNHSGKSET